MQEETAVNQINLATGTLGDMPHITLGDRINYALDHDQQKDRLVSVLAATIGVGHTALTAMRKSGYEKPRDWSKVKKLAIETGWSYEWLREGKNKTPVRMSKEEEAHLRSELESNNLSSSTAPAVTKDSDPINEEVFVRILFSIAASLDAIGKPMSSTQVVRIAVRLYNEFGGRDFDYPELSQLLKERLT